MPLQKGADAHAGRPVSRENPRTHHMVHIQDEDTRCSDGRGRPAGIHAAGSGRKDDGS